VLVTCLFQSAVLYEIPLIVSCSCFQPNLNILFCSQKGHFKGMLFHQVIKHYVIQAGHNKGSGATEEWNLLGKKYARFLLFVYLQFDVYDII